MRGSRQVRFHPSTSVTITDIRKRQPGIMAAIDRDKFRRLADAFAVALAASLPWSTSATAIFAVLWLLAALPGLDWSQLKKVLLSPAGGLPIVLVGLGLVGTLWADVSWAERVNGLSSFGKLLFVPLLLTHYRITHYRNFSAGRPALLGFVGSCIILLAASWLFTAWPELRWYNQINTIGIPVKDYISQAAMFTICIFVIAQISFDALQSRRFGLGLGLLVLCLLFMANIFYVATSRTSLVIIPVLLFMFGTRNFGWKGATALILGFIMLTATVWQSADYLRLRVDSFFTEIQAYRSNGRATSAGERLEFWRKSISFIETSPLIGHGTGSIKEQFARSAVDQTGMAAEIAANPHNQILAVGIQLGLVGIAILLAMWTAHVALFRSGSFPAWVGLVVVIQNVVGSLFNSHLFDFTHGWTYVVGVGIAGGMALNERAALMAKDS